MSAHSRHATQAREELRQLYAELADARDEIERADLQWHIDVQRDYLERVHGINGKPPTQPLPVHQPAYMVTASGPQYLLPGQTPTAEVKGETTQARMF